MRSGLFSVLVPFGFTTIALFAPAPAQESRPGPVRIQTGDPRDDEMYDRTDRLMKQLETTLTDVKGASETVERSKQILDALAAWAKEGENQKAVIHASQSLYAELYGVLSSMQERSGRVLASRAVLIADLHAMKERTDQGCTRGTSSERRGSSRIRATGVARRGQPRAGRDLVRRTECQAASDQRREVEGAATNLETEPDDRRPAQIRGAPEEARGSQPEDG